MCFTVAVSLSPENLSQKRPLPAHLISANQKPSILPCQATGAPANKVSSEPLSAPKDDSRAEPLSISSVFSSDNDDYGTNASVGPVTKAPVKHQVSKQETFVTPNLQVPGKEIKQAKTTKKKTRSVPLPATHQSFRVTTTDQSAPQVLKKAVSFSDKLTRGPGRSYTPPTNERTFRFAPTLVHEDTLGRSDLSPGTSRAYSFDQFTADVVQSPGISETDITSCVPKQSPGESISSKHSHGDNMGVNQKFEAHDEHVYFDIASDSDDSFTDIVVPIAPTKGNASQRHDAELNYHLQSPRQLDRFSNLAQEKFSGGQVMSQSELGDGESYIASAFANNTRRNSLSEIPANQTYAKLNSTSRHVQKRAAAAPIFNRYGHKPRTSSVTSSLFDQSSRRSWPQAVFIRRGQNPSTVSGRPGPAFLLRNGSTSDEAIIRGPRKQQAISRYQPPSVIDDQVDDTAYVDPATKMTCRDV
ncbi:MAG: hypothetical protein Q9170_006579 [Blastenia crenularia]